MSLTTKHLRLPLTALALLPLTASAHDSITHATSIAAGFTHPFSGADHLLAMLAVGFLSIKAGSSNRYAMPISFMLALALGGAMGIAGLAMPYVEGLILASVLVLGLLMASNHHLSRNTGIALAASVALLHGHAHGTEIPAFANALGYSSGFLLGSGVIMVAGQALAGLLLRVRVGATLSRISGGLIAVGALVLG